jgi:hypothetical protein
MHVQMVVQGYLQMQDRKATIFKSRHPPGVTPRGRRAGERMSYSWGAGNAARVAGRHGRAALEAVPTPVPVLARDVRATPPPDDWVAAPVEHQRVAVELAPMVEVWQRLLVEHVPDGAGRCRTCTKGGTGLPSSPWPCSIHGIADLARRRHDADLDGSGRQDRLSS